MSFGQLPAFFTYLSKINADVWETELDRIQIIECEPHGPYLIRLVGPGACLYLCLRAAEKDGLIWVMHISTDAVPKHSKDLMEYNVTSKKYFADVYAPLHGQGLDRWEYYHQPPRGLRHAPWKWLFYVIAELECEPDFQLEVSAAFQSSDGPLRSLWRVLLQQGQHQDESGCRTRQLDDSEAGQRGSDYDEFRGWREKFSAWKDREDLMSNDQARHEGTLVETEEGVWRAESPFLLHQAVMPGLQTAEVSRQSNEL